jgi:hypothetical protein
VSSWRGPSQGAGLVMTEAALCVMLVSLGRFWALERRTFILRYVLCRGVGAPGCPCRVETPENESGLYPGQQAGFGAWESGFIEYAAGHCFAGVSCHVCCEAGHSWAPPAGQETTGGPAVYHGDSETEQYGT